MEHSNTRAPRMYVTLLMDTSYANSKAGDLLRVHPRRGEVWIERGYARYSTSEEIGEHIGRRRDMRSLQDLEAAWMALEQ